MVIDATVPFAGRARDNLFTTKLPDSPDSTVHAHEPAKVTQTTSDGALMDRAVQCDQLNQTSSSITTQSWTHGPNQSWQGHGWNIHKTCGTHQITTIGGGYQKTKVSFTGDRWTQLTRQVNTMTHTTLTHSNLSISFAIMKPSFSSMSKRARESFAASASAKT